MHTLLTCLDANSEWGNWARLAREAVQTHLTLPGEGTYIAEQASKCMRELRIMESIRDEWKEARQTEDIVGLGSHWHDWPDEGPDFIRAMREAGEAEPDHLWTTDLARRRRERRDTEAFEVRKLAAEVRTEYVRERVAKELGELPPADDIADAGAA